MAVVLAVTGVVVHRIFASDLDGTIDRSLASRLGEVAALVRQTDDGLRRSLGGSSADDHDFAQVLRPDGSALASTPRVGGRRLLDAATLARATRRPVAAAHAPIGGLDGRLRMRAAPVDAPGGRVVVVVGTALGERDDSLRTLAVLLAAGGAVALLLACLAGYGVATGALRPVEAMRRRAAAISPARSGQRLPVSRADDEIGRLGTTLNEMLDRLEAAFARERTFTSDASHELRTPLSILRTEIDLALRRGRSAEELRAALRSAAEETDRLVGLAEDLLVIARLDQGRLELRAGEVDAERVLAAVAARFEGRGREAGRAVRADGDGRADAPRTTLRGDALRLEQAVGNLVDNALRHGAGDVGLRAVARDGVVELHVTDDGPGFDPAFLPQAFERFARADGARSRGGTGLGLAIAEAIAASHGGRARAANRSSGGADVWIELPAVGPDLHRPDLVDAEV
jgi:signal transduction histidine kinase